MISLKLVTFQFLRHFQKSEEEIERLAEYSASMYAKSADEKAYYLDYYRKYYRNEGTSQKAGQTSTSTATSSGNTTVTVNGVEYKRYRKSFKVSKQILQGGSRFTNIRTLQS